jgi:uncharacterized protein (DUF2267 family)
MQYRHMVKTVQDYSGFSDSEADEVLRLVVETIAGRETLKDALSLGEINHIRTQLPGQLVMELH